jgi:hypothetical protein
MAADALAQSPSPQGHGSRASYLLGCRCEDCRAANANYQHEYRLGRRGTYSNKLPPLPVVVSPS